MYDYIDHLSGHLKSPGTITEQHVTRSFEVNHGAFLAIQDG